MFKRSPASLPNASAFFRATPQREPAGEPVPYRGYLLVPMTETLATADGGPGRTRTRWDVIEQVSIEGRPPLSNRVKTCASQTTAEGWVDAFGEYATGSSPHVEEDAADDAAME